MAHILTDWHNRLCSVRYKDDRTVCEFLGIRIKFRRPRFKHIRFKFSPSQGLGNRIKPIIASLYYDNPASIAVFWPVRGWVSAKFSDLFSFHYDGKFAEYSDTSEVDFETASWIDEPSHILKLKQRFRSGSIDFRYNGIDANIVRDYAGLFAKLAPSAAVADRAKQVSLPDKYVCVHVRNNADWAAFGRNEDIDKFIDMMKVYPLDTMFYLSAMNKETAGYMRAAFPDRIIELPNKDYHSMIDAATDLFLLGTADDAIYSYGSTFCEVAWWLGGAKSHVRLVGNEGNWF